VVVLSIRSQIRWSRPPRPGLVKGSTHCGFQGASRAVRQRPRDRFLGPYRSRCQCFQASGSQKRAVFRPGRQDEQKVELEAVLNISGELFVASIELGFRVEVRFAQHRLQMSFDEDRVRDTIAVLGVTDASTGAGAAVSINSERTPAIRT
jgi:hypothetical protein